MVKIPIFEEIVIMRKGVKFVPQEPQQVPQTRLAKAVQHALKEGGIPLKRPGVRFSPPPYKPLPAKLEEELEQRRKKGEWLLKSR